MKSLIGRIAIITGAASGIGRCVALALARRGVRIVAADINSTGLAAVAEDIASHGAEALNVTIDIAQPDAFEIIRTAALNRFGKVDVLINNAGVLVSGSPIDIPLSEWERVIALNLMSAIRAVHLFLPDMIARGEGHIVNVASFAGLFPYAYDRLPYAASKAALISLSEGLWLYSKPRGVGITCLCPGPVKTSISSNLHNWTPGIGKRGPGAQFAMIDPAAVGEMVADAVEAERFFLPTDDKVFACLQARAADPNAFLAAQLSAMQSE